ncbi:hypothetical protein [Buttiauxella izardii]
MLTNKLFRTLVTLQAPSFSSAFTLCGEQHWRNAL